MGVGTFGESYGLENSGASSIFFSLARVKASFVWLRLSGPTRLRIPPGRRSPIGPAPGVDRFLLCAVIDWRIMRLHARHCRPPSSICPLQTLSERRYVIVLPLRRKKNFLHTARTEKVVENVKDRRVMSSIKRHFVTCATTFFFVPSSLI